MVKSPYIRHRTEGRIIVHLAKLSVLDLYKHFLGWGWVRHKLAFIYQRKSLLSKSLCFQPPGPLRASANSFIWGVINTCAHCKIQFYTINSSESFKDYSPEIFSQACQLMFTLCAAAQINAPAPNGEAWARRTEWSVFNLLAGTIQKALLWLPFFHWANYKPLIIINRVSWIRASIN